MKKAKRVRGMTVHFVHHCVLVPCLVVAAVGCGTTEQVTRDSGDPGTEDVLVLLHGNVVSPARGIVQRDCALVIRDGRIASLGPSDSVAIPDSAEQRDLAGAFIVPGLIDSHVHLREPAESLALFPSYGVTTVVNLEGEEGHLALRDAVLAEEVFGPRIYSSGPFIEEIVRSPEEAVQEVRRQHDLGYDLIKIHGDMDRAVFDAVVEEAARRGLPVVGHHPESLETEAVLNGLDALAHAEELLGSSLLERPTVLSSEEIDAIARAVSESDTHVITTLHFFSGMREQATDRFYRMITRPELAYVSPVRRRAWLYDGHRKYIEDTELPWYDRAVQNLHEITAAIHEHGGAVMAGTDTPLEFTIPGASLHSELRHLVDAGLTPLEALGAATVVPADFLGARHLGRIEPGAAADLLILERDPTTSVEALGEMKAVVLRGRWHSMDDLHGIRDAVAAKYAREEVDRAAREWLQGEVVQVLRDEGLDAALSELRRVAEIPGAPVMTEQDFNQLGYQMLGEDAISDAIAIFRLNAQLHPESANVHDSLGEACLAAGRLDEAERHYRHALELDDTMGSARQGLQRIREIRDAGGPGERSDE